MFVQSAPCQFRGREESSRALNVHGCHARLDLESQIHHKNTSCQTTGLKIMMLWATTSVCKFVLETAGFAAMHCLRCLQRHNWNEFEQNLSTWECNLFRGPDRSLSRVANPFICCCVSLQVQKTPKPGIKTSRHTTRPVDNRVISKTASITGAYLMVFPVRSRTHCGIGRFVFIFFANFRLIFSDLWAGCWRSTTWEEILISRTHPRKISTQS